MDIAQLGGRDGEVNKVFLNFKNVDGSGSVTVNDPVAYANIGDSVDGISSTYPAAASLKSFIGIADQTVAINGFGRAQAHGYRDSIKISNETTSITITAGDALIPLAGSVGLSSGGFNNGKYCVISATATLSQGQTYASGMIHALG